MAIRALPLPETDAESYWWARENVGIVKGHLQEGKKDHREQRRQNKQKAGPLAQWRVIHRTYSP